MSREDTHESVGLVGLAGLIHNNNTPKVTTRSEEIQSNDSSQLNNYR